MCVCLYYLYIYLFVNLPVCLSLYLFVGLSLCIYRSICRCDPRVPGPHLPDVGKHSDVFCRKITIFKGKITIFKGKITIFKGKITIFKGKITIFKGKITIFKGKITIFKGKITIQSARIRMSVSQSARLLRAVSGEWSVLENAPLFTELLSWSATRPKSGLGGWRPSTLSQLYRS